MRRMAVLLLTLLTMALLPNPALADSDMPQPHWANRQLPDARQEAQARALMGSLRCLVCQGQSVADSDADLAGSMRAMVRTRIAAGQSPDAVRAWLVSRYGNWVSLAPPVQPLTWALWAAPWLLLVAALWLARKRFLWRAP